MTAQVLGQSTADEEIKKRLRRDREAITTRALEISEMRKPWTQSLEVPKVEETTPARAPAGKLVTGTETTVVGGGGGLFFVWLLGLVGVEIPPEVAVVIGGFLGGVVNAITAKLRDLGLYKVGTTSVVLLFLVVSTTGCVSNFQEALMCRVLKAPITWEKACPPILKGDEAEEEAEAEA